MIRKRTTCRVPGHGTRCEVAREKPTRYPRSTEKRMTFDLEDEPIRPHVPIIHPDAPSWCESCEHKINALWHVQAAPRPSWSTPRPGARRRLTRAQRRA